MAAAAAQRAAAAAVAAGDGATVDSGRTNGRMGEGQDARARAAPTALHCGLELTYSRTV